MSTQKTTLKKWLDAHEKMIKAGRKKHKKDMFQQIAYKDMSACLQNIRDAVDNDDIENAVLSTARFVKKVHGYSIRLSIPEISSMVRKKSSKVAHEGKAWKPAQLKALMKEYGQLINAGKSHYAACQELANNVFEDKKKWRQIETQVRKNTPSK